MNTFQLIFYGQHNPSTKNRAKTLKENYKPTSLINKDTKNPQENIIKTNNILKNTL